MRPRHRFEGRGKESEGKEERRQGGARQGGTDETALKRVGVVGRCRLFHPGFPSPVSALPYCSQSLREVPCYAWPDISLRNLSMISWRNLKFVRFKRSKASARFRR